MQVFCVSMVSVVGVDVEVIIGVVVVFVGLVVMGGLWMRQGPIVK